MIFCCPVFSWESERAWVQMSLFLDYFSYAFYHGLNSQNVSPFACAQSCASSLTFWEWCGKTFVQELRTPLVLQKQLDLWEINVTAACTSWMEKWPNLLFAVIFFNIFSWLYSVCWCGFAANLRELLLRGKLVTEAVAVEVWNNLRGWCELGFSRKGLL